MADHPLIVVLDQLRKHLGERVDVSVSGEIPDLQGPGGRVPPDEPVRADLSVESVDGGVEVTGSVKVAWTGTCRRCLSDAAGELQTTVLEKFAPGGDGDEVYPLVGDALDLEPMLRDAVLLDLPVAPLCRPECRGLCATCGANLNDEVCSCKPERDLRWAELDRLLEEAEAVRGSDGDTVA